MRIGVAWERVPNASYRAIEPMNALARRGHEIVWPADVRGACDEAKLARCDVVHIYRRLDDDTKRIVTNLARAGVPISYDNDDYFAALPKESPNYKTHGGLTARKLMNRSLGMAQRAHAFSAPSQELVDLYAKAGIENGHVIPNGLAPQVWRHRRKHDGVVIGWIASAEHHADSARLGIAAALEEVLSRLADARVESIGIDLKLSERYRYDRLIPFEELPKRTAGFDIGIAPLADIAWNRARSDIKLKEYAASGVAWLASPVGPYVGLGEDEGGRLVADDEWVPALERLVTKRRERGKLAKKGKRWARSQTVDRLADAWERLLAAAISASKNNA
jgi:glycosyltransferase involved in cell wall biosynthesis